MFARKGLFSSIGRAGAVATIAAVALTAVEPSMAFAGSATSGKGVTASAGTSVARPPHLTVANHIDQRRAAH